MKVPALQHHIAQADLPLEKIAGNPNLSDEEKIAEASRQFEAVLLRQVLASAQKSVVASRFNPQSFSSGVYQDMMTTQLAEKISQSGALGLGQGIAAQLAAREPSMKLSSGRECKVHSPPAAQPSAAVDPLSL